ncbi:agamous-like MADS-box protein AGL3 [Pyrus communis]|uniref:agamous-like MADS-box protein AGL3 n=1 Tax=Pyrus communis TaxID=23211 RepID=UPI0035C03607
MGRGRLNMELITNERARKTTFQKRTKGILKKAGEISTLCDLDVCMIIYGPKQSGRSPELHTWPRNPSEVNRIINKYKASTTCKPAKKTFNLSDLLMDRKTKVHVDTYRARKEMYEAKYPTWDERIENFSENELELLLNALDAKLEAGKRTLLHKRNRPAEHQYICSSTQKQPCNYYKPDQNNNNVEDKNPMTSCSWNRSNMDMVETLQPFPVSSFDHHHQQQHPSDQMLRFDNSNEYTNSVLAPNNNLGPLAMWMLMESKYNHSSLQLTGGASGCNSQLPFEGRHHSNFDNPMMIQSTVENMNMNMNMMRQEYYSARLMQQPAVPYLQYPVLPASVSSSHQVHQVQASHQVVRDDDQYEDISQYLVMNNKMA